MNVKVEGASSSPHKSRDHVTLLHPTSGKISLGWTSTLMESSQALQQSGNLRWLCLGELGGSSARISHELAHGIVERDRKRL